MVGIRGHKNKYTNKTERDIISSWGGVLAVPAGVERCWMINFFHNERRGRAFARCRMADCRFNRSLVLPKEHRRNSQADSKSNSVGKTCVSKGEWPW